MRLLLRIIINAFALWLAAKIVPGLVVTGDLLPLLMLAIIFGLVNTFIRPIAKLLTFPINFLTLGLFSLVINALMLMLTDFLSQGRMTIEGNFFQRFLIAFIASIIISVVSTLANRLLPDKK